MTCPWQTQDQCMAVKIPVAEIKGVLETNYVVIKPLVHIIITYLVPAKNIEWRFQNASLASSVNDHVKCLIMLMCRINGDEMCNKEIPHYWPLGEWTSKSEILTLFAGLHDCLSHHRGNHLFHIRCAIKWCEDNGFAVSRRFCRDSDEDLFRKTSLASHVNKLLANKTFLNG